MFETSTATCPPGWGVDKLTRNALNLYDSVRLMGPKLEFERWHQVFRPNSNRQASKRAWERQKKAWRDCGVQFEMIQVERSGVVDYKGGGATWHERAVLFPSVGYALAMVDALIGPADPESTGAPTLGLYDLFPGEDPKDVDELLAALWPDGEDTIDRLAEGTD